MTEPAPDTVEALLQQAVALNSVNTVSSGDPCAEANVAAYLEAAARAMGFATARLPVPQRGDNLLVRHEVAPDRPWLLFESHMDTVSVDGMSIDPFAARIEDGRLWGRGACDTKGTGAAMLWAMREYAQQGETVHNIALLFSIDEEHGMAGVRSFLARDRDRIGFEPRGVIVGEPTLLKAVVAHNGAARWRISTSGVAAHSATPHLGRSAIRAMVRVVDAIESDYIAPLKTEHPLTGTAQCSINVIRGGAQINVIADACTIEIDRRIVPGEDPDAALPALQRVLDRLADSDPALDTRCETFFDAPPLTPDVSRSFLPTVQDVLQRHGLDTEPIGVPYVTDAGDLGTAGWPAVVLGPGDIAQAHTRDEWIELDQLRAAVRVYLDIMRTDGRR